MHRRDDEHVVDVETRVAVIERQETVNGDLGAEVVVLATEHLLAHTSSDLSLEVEDGAKAKVATFATPVVPLLDAPTAFIPA